MSKDNRSFEEVVRGIGLAEDDVDKVLKAARLERNEGQSNKLSAEQKTSIIFGILGLLGACVFFGFLILGTIL